MIRKITIVERHPPPNFHAAIPAIIPLNGPCIFSPLNSFYQEVKLYTNS